MNATVMLSPGEEFDLFFRDEQTYSYEVTSGRGAARQEFSGTIVISESREESSNRTITVFDESEGGLEAPQPLVRRRRKNIPVVNQQPRQIRFRIHS